ncbi:hypothetical protein M413DRAFT_446473 [Hebeloma cylindrosporum]|uniref:Uncharacterized protein n=1 Tax=Hebeloma cylindrosporum TaxID=76867 RepID=A0A0C3C9N5_HEBCY|nr:hypothetical protein M413DRAFT_446473 [Hebeloma cylindrosporum h7]
MLEQTYETTSPQGPRPNLDRRPHFIYLNVGEKKFDHLPRALNGQPTFTFEIASTTQSIPRIVSHKGISVFLPTAALIC